MRNNRPKINVKKPQGRVNRRGPVRRTPVVGRPGARKSSGNSGLIIAGIVGFILLALVIIIASTSGGNEDAYIEEQERIKRQKYAAKEAEAERVRRAAQAKKRRIAKEKARKAKAERDRLARLAAKNRKTTSSKPFVVERKKPLSTEDIEKLKIDLRPNSYLFTGDDYIAQRKIYIRQFMGKTYQQEVQRLAIIENFLMDIINFYEKNQLKTVLYLTNDSKIAATVVGADMDGLSIDMKGEKKSCAWSKLKVESLLELYNVSFIRQEEYIAFENVLESLSLGKFAQGYFNMAIFADWYDSSEDLGAYKARIKAFKPEILPTLDPYLEDSFEAIKAKSESEWVEYNKYQEKKKSETKPEKK